MSESSPRTDSAILRAESLVVVNIPIEQVKGKEADKLNNQGWWHKLLADRDIWVSPTCSRVVLITTKDHWDNELGSTFPQLTTRCMTQELAAAEKETTGHDPFTLPKPYFMKKGGYDETEGVDLKYKKWEAYAYLLELVCGMHSSDPGEEHISHQILDESYTEHKRLKHGNRPLWLDPVITELKHDARQVREVIGPHIPPTEEDTARDLADLKPGARVLVVTDKWAPAEKMLSALGRGPMRGKIDTIDVAHIAPKEDSIGRLQSHIDMMKSENKSLPRTLSAMPLAEVLEMGDEWLRDYNAIIVVSELNKHPAEERRLIQAWQRCSEKCPKFIALRLDRDYEDELMPHAELKQLRGAYVLLPDEIEQDFKTRMAQYKVLLEQGKHACDLCARIRHDYKGKHRPVGALLSRGYDEYVAQHPIEPFFNRPYKDRKTGGGELPGFS